MSFEVVGVLKTDSRLTGGGLEPLPNNTISQSYLSLAPLFFLFRVHQMCSIDDLPREIVAKILSGKADHRN